MIVLLSSRTPVALGASGLVALLGAGVGLVVAIPDLKLIDLDPLGQFQEPSYQMDITSRSGPVRIQINYTIAIENTEQFLSKLSLRRRVRVRDGAGQWLLLRDVENPALWKETYSFATWAAYLRCNQRQTQADAKISLEIHKLCLKGTEPVIRRMIERHHVPSVDDLAIKPNPEI